jgi:uncharacterized phage protein (TIGR02216 family)
MEAGLGLLRLAPDVFWRMTPRELDAALRGAFGATARQMPMGRADLAALMAAHPDAPVQHEPVMPGLVPGIHDLGQ